MTVRSNINLMKLKNSSLPKHKKIYNKALRIMAEGNNISTLSESEIEKIAMKYPQLKVHPTINGDVINISSKCDNWIAVNENLFFTLYHEELECKNGKFTHGHHVQDVFYDLDFLLASIVSHDEYKISNVENTMDDIRELVEKNTALAEQGIYIENTLSC